MGALQTHDSDSATECVRGRAIIVYCGVSTGMVEALGAKTCAEVGAVMNPTRPGGVLMDTCAQCMHQPT